MTRARQFPAILRQNAPGRPTSCIKVTRGRYHLGPAGARSRRSRPGTVASLCLRASTVGEHDFGIERVLRKPAPPRLAELAEELLEPRTGLREIARIELDDTARPRDDAS